MSSQNVSGKITKKKKNQYFSAGKKALYMPQYLGSAMQKRVFGHIWAVKAQISLCIWAV